jgi:O-phosphoseryl-tRNA(Cys) synthetase
VVKESKKKAEFQIKMAKTPADINISISERARRATQSKNKEIYIKGPIFTTIGFKEL